MIKNYCSCIKEPVAILIMQLLQQQQRIRIDVDHSEAVQQVFVKELEQIKKSSLGIILGGHYYTGGPHQFISLDPVSVWVRLKNRIHGQGVS